jgi:DNA-binding transcriptional ArsR family regulator
MSRIDKRVAFKRAVFVGRMPDSVKVLLLRLLEDMDAKLIVSVPRSKLAEDLGVPMARISERIKVARELGYLDQVRRGRPGVTAVYQGLRGTGSVPRTEVRPPVPQLGTGSVPQSGGLEVRPDHTQVGTGRSERTGPFELLHRRGIEEEPCRWHRHDGCPADCADHPANREASA